MNRISFSEFKQRYDDSLAPDLVRICIKRGFTLNLQFIDEKYTTKILQANLDDDNPYIVLDTLDPRPGNKLAQRNKEVIVRFDFINKGLIYHAGFKMILWGLKEADNIPKIYATPPLDIHLASETYNGRPTPEHPLYISFSLFNEDHRLPVALVTRNGVVFENRLVADSLPTLVKQTEAVLYFGREKQLPVQGVYKEAGEDKVQFVFAKMTDETLRPIASLLEALYLNQLEKAALQKEKKKSGMKHVSAQQFKLLFYTVDKQYVASLTAAFEHRSTRVFTAGEHAEFIDLLGKQNWDLLLLDGQTPELDLWKLTQEVREHYKGRGVKCPPMILLSDDLSEDTVVYAQYCSLEHIYERAAFAESAVTNIGLITGHPEWVQIDQDQKSVVVIDDDRNVTFTLQHSLSQEGYRPIVVRKGKDGVRAVKQYKPVCVVMETALRSGDGKEALKLISKLPYTRDIPVIVLSVSKEEEDIKFAKFCDVKVYLNKPVDTAEIINNINILSEQNVKKK